MYTMHVPIDLQQFNGNTHATKPSDDPERKMPTPDEFVADFKALIEASFCVADQMEKYLI